MKLSTAIEGFMLHLSSGNYSEGTVRLYRDNLKNLVQFLDNPEVEGIKLMDLQRFMVYLKTEYTPTRFGGSTRPISSAHIDNHWKAIRTFFRWAEDVLELPRPDSKLSRPKFKAPEVVPFSPDEIRKMLAVCDMTNPIIKLNGQVYKRKIPTALRNRAIIMVLLDSGMRIGELCRMQCRDVDLTAGAMSIAPYGTGKKTKPRTVYLGKAARRALWLYLAKREYDPEDNLISLTINSVRNFLKHIERKSGVSNVHPHRFRHTFAIMYLRNKGDVFTLQRLLGHSDLEMTKRYLNIVKTDIEAMHRLASPADNLKL